MRYSPAHPEYRYPSARNPYAARLKEFPERGFCDHETEAHRGEWRSAFPAASGRPDWKPELHVELGCNGGHVVLEWAAANPSAAWVGVDWKFKQIYRAALKASQRNLGNVLFFRAHAERVPFMFGPGEIDRLYLFFPDPWPRKSQWKHRFVTAENLRALARAVRPGGTFWIKTDHAGYFEWMEAELAKVAGLWTPLERSTDLHAGHPNLRLLQIPEVTLFERIFIAQGIPIHSLRLERTGKDQSAL